MDGEKLQEWSITTRVAVKVERKIHKREVRQKKLYGLGTVAITRRHEAALKILRFFWGKNR